MGHSPNGSGVGEGGEWGVGENITMGRGCQEPSASGRSNGRGHISWNQGAPGYPIASTVGGLHNYAVSMSAVYTSWQTCV